jgi:hypothetical protein
MMRQSKMNEAKRKAQSIDSQKYFSPKKKTEQDERGQGGGEA